MQPKDPVVLLVEDNSTLRSTLRRYLDRRFPVCLIEASSADDALAMSRCYNPAVILLDLSLPDASGVSVIRRLQIERRQVRVIAMASYLERQHSEAVTQAGAWACVPKETLGSQLEELLWRALPSEKIGLTARMTRWRVIFRASRVGFV